MIYSVVGVVPGGLEYEYFAHDLFSYLAAYCLAVQLFHSDIFTDIYICDKYNIIKSFKVKEKKIMVVNVVGKKKGISKKGNPYHTIMITYPRSDVDGLVAEGKFVSEEQYNKVVPGKSYDIQINFSGFIEGILESK